MLSSDGGHNGKIYTLSGPESLSNAEFAEKFSAGMGQKVNYVDISDQDFKKSLLGVGVPESLANGIIELQHYYISGKAARVTPDVQQIQDSVASPLINSPATTFLRFSESRPAWRRQSSSDGDWLAVSSYAGAGSWA